MFLFGWIRIHLNCLGCIYIAVSSCSQAGSFCKKYLMLWREYCKQESKKVNEFIWVFLSKKSRCLEMSRHSLVGSAIESCPPTYSQIDREIFLQLSSCPAACIEPCNLSLYSQIDRGIFLQLLKASWMWDRLGIFYFLLFFLRLF